MLFSSAPFVLALSLFATASPTPSPDTEVAARQTVPNTSVAPLTVFSTFQTLKSTTDKLLPGLTAITAAAGPAGQAGSVVPLVSELTAALNKATTSLASLSPGDAGGANEDIAALVADILNGVNTALNKLVPKLGLNGVLSPLDAALTGLLTGLGGVLQPVLVLVGGLLIPVGGIVGGLLQGLGIAGL